MVGKFWKVSRARARRACAAAPRRAWIRESHLARYFQKNPPYSPSSQHHEEKGINGARGQIYPRAVPFILFILFLAAGAESINCGGGRT
ncbi:MAG: hypothetical protein ACK4OP_00410 [Gemmobacter sp.]